MAEVGKDIARRNEQNTFTEKARFNKVVQVDGGAANKGMSVTATTGNTANLLEIVLSGTTILSIAVNVGGTIETISLYPGGSNQAIIDVASSRYKTGYDGNAYVDSVNKEVQLRANGTPNVRVGQSATLGFYNATPAAKQTVSGAKGSNAALGSLLTALAALGLVTDSTTA